MCFTIAATRRSSVPDRESPSCQLSATQLDDAWRWCLGTSLHSGAPWGQGDAVLDGVSVESPIVV